MSGCVKLNTCVLPPQSDYHFEYTECDVLGSRWRVAVPNKADTCTGLPDPVKGTQCSECPPLTSRFIHFLHVTTLHILYLFLAMLSSSPSYLSNVPMLFLSLSQPSPVVRGSSSTCSRSSARSVLRAPTLWAPAWPLMSGTACRLALSPTG